MLGYTIEEMIGRPVTDFMDAAAQKQFAANMERRREGFLPHDVRFRRKDGATVITSLEATSLLSAVTLRRATTSAVRCHPKKCFPGYAGGKARMVGSVRRPTRQPRFGLPSRRIPVTRCQ